MTATKMYPTKCAFQRCIDYVDVARRSFIRWRQTRVGWEKQANLTLNVSISGKLYEIHPRLLLMTNRKLHTCCRLTRRSMTFDDLELYKFEFCREFRGISPIWDITTAKRTKIEPYRQRQHCNPLNLLFSIMFLQSICCRFLC